MSGWTGLGEAARAHPDGDSTAARLAMVAGRVGYETLVLRNGDTLSDSPGVDDIVDATGVDVVRGVELEGPVETVSGRLPHLRGEIDVILVAGGTTERNRFIASQAHVDVLTRPVGPDGPDLDPGVVTSATEHEVAIEVDLGPVRSAVGGQRVRYLDRLRRLWRIIDHYDAPHVLTATPTSHLDVVAPRELAALAEVVGIDTEAAHQGLATWRTIARADR